MNAQPPLRWGILGPGRIAERFCQSMPQVDGCVISAIASRDAARASAFAARFGGARTHTSYAALAEDPSVDIVYIATPHTFHAAQIRLCLEAGKHVLCEKPITISAAELEPLITLAARQNCFLMEGLWSRFLPAWQQMRRWIDTGRIGEPRMASAHFGFRSEWNPQGRLLNPALAGGAMWDVGIYTLAFATSALGCDLVRVQGSAYRGKTGVDEQTALVLELDGGRLATLSCAVRTTLPQTAWGGGHGRPHRTGGPLLEIPPRPSHPSQSKNQKKSNYPSKKAVSSLRSRTCATACARDCAKAPSSLSPKAFSGSGQWTRYSSPDPDGGRSLRETGLRISRLFGSKDGGWFKIIETKKGRRCGHPLGKVEVRGAQGASSAGTGSAGAGSSAAGTTDAGSTGVTDSVTGTTDAGSVADSSGRVDTCGASVSGRPEGA